MPNWTIWVLLFVLIIVYVALRRTTPKRRTKRDFTMPPEDRTTAKTAVPPSKPESQAPAGKSETTEKEHVEENDTSGSDDHLDDLESALDDLLGDDSSGAEPDTTRGGTEDAGTPPPPPAAQNDKVTFGVFTSEGIQAGGAFILDVWAYLMKDFATVSQMARMMNRDAALGMKAGVNIERGTILTLQVEVGQMHVQDPVQTMVWDGDPVNCSFVVDAPGQLATASYPGRVVISSHGVPFASIAFAIQVLGSPREEPVKVSGAPTYPRSAFASYASKNRDEVLGRIHGMLKVVPDLDVFLDAMTLRSGQDWAGQLETQILSRDILYLFWSPDAAASPWVEKEWKLALEKKGIATISPVPLVDPRDAPPPAELGSLHFNDAHVAMIQYERMRQQLGK